MILRPKGAVAKKQKNRWHQNTHFVSCIRPLKLFCPNLGRIDPVVLEKSLKYPKINMQICLRIGNWQSEHINLKYFPKKETVSPCQGGHVAYMRGFGLDTEGYMSRQKGFTTFGGGGHIAHLEGCTHIYPNGYTVQQ